MGYYMMLYSLWDAARDDVAIIAIATICNLILILIDMVLGLTRAVFSKERIVSWKLSVTFAKALAVFVFAFIGAVFVLSLHSHTILIITMIILLLAAIREMMSMAEHMKKMGWFDKVYLFSILPKIGKLMEDKVLNYIQYGVRLSKNVPEKQMTSDDKPVKRKSVKANVEEEETSLDR